MVPHPPDPDPSAPRDEPLYGPARAQELLTLRDELDGLEDRRSTRRFALTFAALAAAWLVVLLLLGAPWQPCLFLAVLAALPITWALLRDHEVRGRRDAIESRIREIEALPSPGARTPPPERG